MRRWLAFSLLCASSFPQVATTVSESSQEDAGFVVHINVNLVQVDAVVTDLKGKRVTDLTADDFELLQDGVPQKITNFSYVAEGTTPAGMPPATGSRENNSSIPAPPVPLKPGQIHRVIALVVDDLGLSFTSVAYVHAALKKFVDHEIQPGDLVAIIRTSGGVGALQQFTTDKRLLYAAIDQVKFKFTARAARFLPGVLARTLEPPSVGPAHQAADSRGATAFKNLEESANCMEETGSTAGSIGAMRYVVEGLRDLPGRKALVFFSENLPMAARPDQVNDRSEPGDCDYSDIRETMRKLTDAAERAAVVIYSVDARGLTSLMPDASSNPFAAGPLSSSQTAQEILAQERQNTHADYYKSQAGLQYLADETGGMFVIHNDIAGAIREAVDDSGNYYLIGYHPPANTFEVKNGRPKFHPVTVRVKRFGLRVRSRTGFYGFPGKENENPVSQSERFARTLVSPFAQNDIHVRMTTFFSQWEKPSLTTMLYLNAGDLTFGREADGERKAALDAIAVTFDVNGIPVNDTRRTYTFTATEEGYALAVKNGIIFKFQQVLPKAGPYQVRVAVLDKASQKLGSANQFVEVPDIRRGRLTLSGIVLKQLDPNESSPGLPEGAAQTTALEPRGNEAIRIFKPGDTIGWYYQVLNAKRGGDHQASLEVQVRLFRAGSEITRTEPATAHLPQDRTGKRLATSGHMFLTPKFEPGDYALQLVVTDTLARKYSTTSQWIDFAVENP